MLHFMTVKSVNVKTATAEKKQIEIKKRSACCRRRELMEILVLSKSHFEALIET